MPTTASAAARPATRSSTRSATTRRSGRTSARRHHRQRLRPVRLADADLDRPQAAGAARAEFPDIEFYVVHAGITAEHVTDYGLPSSVIKETEERKGAWIDALGAGADRGRCDARPSPRRVSPGDPRCRRAVLRRRPRRRLRQAEEEWQEEAQALVDEAIDADRHGRV